MPDVKDVFDMTTRAIDPDLVDWHEQERRQRRRTRRRHASALALVAGLMLFVAYVATRELATPHTPAKRVTSTGQLGVGRASFFVNLPTGETTPLPKSIAGGYSYRISPDEMMLATVSTTSEVSAVYVANVVGTRIQKITASGANAVLAPSWSPDGFSLVYQEQNGPGIGNLMVIDRPGPDIFYTRWIAGRFNIPVLKQITHFEQFRADVSFMWPSFAPDGRRILFQLPRRHVGPSGQVWDLWSVPVTGGEPVLVRQNASFGSYSPDGRTMAYLSRLNPDASGDVLWLVDADGGRPRPLVEDDAGIWWPSWSPDGTQIAYATNADLIYVVDVATGESTRVAEGGVAEWVDEDTLIVGPFCCRG